MGVRITTGYGLDDSWVPAGLRILHFSLIIETGSWGRGAKLTTRLQLVPCQENMDIYTYTLIAQGKLYLSAKSRHCLS
jgi:hypothetical protein